MKEQHTNRSFRVWIRTTAIAGALLLVLNLVASFPLFNTLCVVLNSPMRMEYSESEENKRFSVLEGADTRESAARHGDEVTQAICEEGFTLLKNRENALPLSVGAKISIFGKNSANMATGGSGSGGSSGIGAKTIYDSLTAAGFSCNPALLDFYNSDLSGKGRDSNPTDLDSGKTVSLSTGETPWEAYSEDLLGSCGEYKDAAIVVLTRIGGEGFDIPRSYLKLDENERALIEHVTAMDFGAVIVLLNMANGVELQELKTNENVDAILWMGYAGDTGIMALGRLLSGAVNPSGKTVDTWAVLTSNPTWNNFGGEIGAKSGSPSYSGDAYLTRARGGYMGRDVYFVDEEEDIYVGYRYYETAYAEHEEGNYDSFDYDEVVAYPFGYGLSYTTFDWELEGGSVIPAALEAGTKIVVKVRVTNTGSVPGRDVVQLYVTPPHTHGGIEKSAKVLVGFAKTDVIEPGKSDTVTITVDSPYAFASYDCYARSGKAGYIVEKGDYLFTISTDAHNAKDMEKAVFHVPAAEDLRFYEDTVQNRYTGNNDKMLDMDAELSVQLSRSDFAGTWPTSRTEEERMISADFYAALTNTEPNPNNPNTYTEIPATGKDQGILMGELVGKAFEDELWEAFLDQLTLSQMVDLVNNGAFQTAAIPEYGVPLTRSTDGPVGWVNFMPGIKEAFDGCCKYCCEEVIAATWNLDRIYEMGLSVGNEGLVGDQASKLPFTGWYAPGLNIHRSPMGGRNFEYYSEDPLLSGMATAAVMKGLADKGVYANIKHFAMNEQETHRSSNGVLTWGTEQAMREIYLKGFEIAIGTAQKDERVKGNGEIVQGGKVTSMGVMSSFNRIGTRWTGGDYRLCTSILRDEWGFQGLVICDFNTCSHMNVKNMIYAGGDLNLEMVGARVWKNPDPSDPADVTMMRRAAKDILYTIANSNAYQGSFIMHRPIWQLVMFAVDAVLAVLLAVWGLTVFLKTRKPE